MIHDSGQIRLDKEIIRYRSATYGKWNLPLSAVRVFGECTNQDGPSLDDYFLCFATGPETWLEASFYAEGLNQFLRELTAKLVGEVSELGLCGSTDFASRVLWPPALAGKPMFNYADLPANGLFRWLFGTTKVQRTYSESVAAALAADR